MANHSLPTLTSTYTNFVSELDGRLDDLAVGMDPAVTTVSNPPANSIRWNSAGKKWEKRSGTAWNELSANYAINLQGPSTVSANSTGDALRITQTGSGNALVIEDETSPDASPFVIDSSGIVLRGLTTARNNIAGGSAALQIEGPNTADSAISVVRRNNAGAINIGRQNGTTNGDNTSVGSPQVIGALNFIGADGTNLIRAASVTCSTDGTVSSGSMPGSLVFATTPSGSSSPSERMRIDNTGAIYSGNNNTNANFTVGAPLVSRGGNTLAIGASIFGQATDSTLTSATGFETYINPSAGVSLTNLTHYGAVQRPFAGGVASNQYGFYSASSLTGASNNYGFYSAIASGTGRWNFYAAGTAANYFAGETTINSGLTIGRTTVTSPAASDGNVFSGTYTPTLTNSTNIDSSTARTCQYMRVGNVVTVSGRVTIDSTATGTASILRMSIPVSSNFAAAENGAGSFRSGGTARINAGVCYAASATDDIVFVIIPETTGADEYYFHFTYRVI